MELPQLKVGEFDLVLMTLNQLEINDHKLSNLIRFMTSITMTLLLLIKVPQGEQDSDKLEERESVIEHTSRLVENNGFRIKQVIHSKLIPNQRILYCQQN
jgi:hypothetical protein